jgi:molecular chaperone GrpE
LSSKIFDLSPDNRKIIRSEEMARKKKHDEDISENIEQKEQNERNEPNDDVNAKEVDKEKQAGNEAVKPSQEEEALQNKLLRLQADFLNYKTRTEREKTVSYNSTVSDVLTEMLPVLDNLERALNKDKSENNSLKEGVQMVYTQYVGILNKLGLKEIDALHKPFDPNLHFGVAFESNKDFKDDTILEVFQKGYTVNDKIIRPSMVKICKN